jgi:hypothetical protein
MTFFMAARTLRRCYGHAVLCILSMSYGYVYSVKLSPESHCFYTTGRKSGSFVLYYFTVGGNLFERDAKGNRE